MSDTQLSTHLLQSVKMLKIKLFYLFEFGSQFLLCNNYTTYLIVCQVLFKENLICFYVITDRAYEMTRDKSTNPATIPFYLIKNYLLLNKRVLWRGSSICLWSFPVSYTHLTLPTICSV